MHVDPSTPEMFSLRNWTMDNPYLVLECSFPPNAAPVPGVGDPEKLPRRVIQARQSWLLTPPKIIRKNALQQFATTWPIYEKSATLKRCLLQHPIGYPQLVSLSGSSWPSLAISEYLSLSGPLPLLLSLALSDL